MKERAGSRTIQHSDFPSCVRQKGAYLLAPVRVLPRSSRNEIRLEFEGLRASLTAAPVEGAANDALVALLAEKLRLPKRQIQVARGATSRQKVMAIEGLAVEEFWRRLEAAGIKKNTAP
jgi:uncharacterized protein YggU (UPF0235/DUF167 family)